MKSSAVFSGVGVFLLATLTNVQMAGAAPEATTTAVPSPPGTAACHLAARNMPAQGAHLGPRRGQSGERHRHRELSWQCRGHDCNPYTGDTSCKLPRPILCIEKNAAAFPVPASVNNSSQYNKWAYGGGRHHAPGQPGALQTSDDQRRGCGMPEGVRAQLPRCGAPRRLGLGVPGIWQCRQSAKALLGQRQRPAQRQLLEELS